MKKLLPLLLILVFATSCLADDRVMSQVRFKKALWTCPKCSQEDTEDRNMSGGDSYEHDCSACSYHFNQSGNNMWEYNGCLGYLKDDYESKKQEDIDKDKQERFDNAVYDKKNPPPYQEPTKWEVEQMVNEKVDEAIRYLEEYGDKSADFEFLKLKSDIIQEISETDKGVTSG